MSPVTVKIATSQTCSCVPMILLCPFRTQEVKFVSKLFNSFPKCAKRCSTSVLPWIAWWIPIFIDHKIGDLHPLYEYDRAGENPRSLGQAIEVEIQEQIRARCKRLWKTVCTLFSMKMGRRGPILRLPRWSILSNQFFWMQYVN